MTNEREIRERARKFRATRSAKEDEVGVMSAFALSERDAAIEQCAQLLENSVDSVHTAHHSRDYCNGYLQGRENLRETIVAAIRSRVAAKGEK